MSNKLIFYDTIKQIIHNKINIDILNKYDNDLNIFFNDELTIEKLINIHEIIISKGKYFNISECNESFEEEDNNISLQIENEAISDDTTKNCKTKLINLLMRCNACVAYV